MALQVFQLDANMTKTVDNRKTFTTSKGNEFNKLLGKIKELTGKRKENKVHPAINAANEYLKHRYFVAGF